MILSAEETHEIAVSYGTIIGTGVLAIIVCGARLATRKFILDALSLDDWACLGALLITTVFNAIGVNVVKNGAGRHIQNVSESELKQWFILYYACTCIYLLISFCVKSSLLLLLWRLFPSTFMRWAVNGLLAFMTLFTISGTFAAAFQCNPPKYVYDVEFVMSPDRAEHCFSNSVAYGVFMYQAVVLFTIDIIILFLPLQPLWGLNMSKGKSMVLFLVFGSAIVACIAPALRFQSLNFYKSGSSDMTFVAASSLYWMAIEYNLGMVAGSLGCLRPLFVKLGLASPSSSTKQKDSDFSPSYQLHNTSSRQTQRRKFSRKHLLHRVQGDSVLDSVPTIPDRLDKYRDEGGSKEYIVKTQEVDVSYSTEPYEDPHIPRFHEHRV